MQPFTSVDASALRWLAIPDPPGTFELRAGDQLLARLVRVRHAGSLAHAETAEGTWTIKRVGFLHPRVTVRREDGAALIARMDIHWRRTLVRVEGSASYTFERAGVAVPAWQFSDAAGQRLVHIEPVRDRRSLIGGSVAVGQAGARLPDLPLLLLIGWYYIVQEWFEDEAVAAGEAILQASAGPSPPTQDEGM